MGSSVVTDARRCQSRQCQLRRRYLLFNVEPSTRSDPAGRAPFPRDSGEHGGSGAFSRVNAASSHLPLRATSSPCRIGYARRINNSIRLSFLSFGLQAPRRDE